MTGCPQKQVRLALQAKGIPVGRGEPLTTEQQLDARRRSEQRRAEALRAAQRALQEAQYPAATSPVGLYLQSRGLPLSATPPNTFDTILETRDPQFPGGVAMLGVICDLTTLAAPPVRSVGMATLSLNHDGTPRLVGGRKFRSIVGTQKGFGVPYGKIGPHMVVAEGIESAISALELLQADLAVAVLSASNMEFLAVPEWVRELSIAADADDPGAQAARRLADNLRGLFRVRVRSWVGPPGFDANDELMRRRDTSSEGPRAPTESIAQ